MDNNEQIEHDKKMAHIRHVKETCKKLNCSMLELLNMDYMTHLGYNKPKIHKPNHTPQYGC